MKKASLALSIILLAPSLCYSLDGSDTDNTVYGISGSASPDAGRQLGEAVGEVVQRSVKPIVKATVKGAGKAAGAGIDLIWPKDAHAPTHDGTGGAVSK